MKKVELLVFDKGPNFKKYILMVIGILAIATICSCSIFEPIEYKKLAVENWNTTPVAVIYDNQVWTNALLPGERISRFVRPGCHVVEGDTGTERVSVRVCIEETYGYLVRFT